jgi:hypothetical protein
MFEPTSSFLSTRRAMHGVAVHVVARARCQATGRFSLRVTPGGFGTPEFGTEHRRLRVAGGLLVVESDAPGAALVEAVSIDGSTLRRLGERAGVDLDTPLDIGRDTPPLGDVDAPISIDHQAAAAIGDWYALVGEALDRVIAELPVGATLPRLWPEHFDVAIETEPHPGRRVNLGGSPGDRFHPEPYCYVGPWGADRPGDQRFWNAPFGAILPASELGHDLVAGATEFLLEGVARLR